MERKYPCDMENGFCPWEDSGNPDSMWFCYNFCGVGACDDYDEPEDDMPDAEVPDEQTVRIMMSSGHGTRVLFMDGLTLREAEEICDGYGWEFSAEVGGFVWDLEIEAED